MTKHERRRRPISGLELLASGAVAAWLGRVIGRKLLGEEWGERAERIDLRADKLAEERAAERKGKRDMLPGFDEMLESRHQGLRSLTVPGSAN